MALWAYGPGGAFGPLGLWAMFRLSDFPTFRLSGFFQGGSWRLKVGKAVKHGIFRLSDFPTFSRGSKSEGQEQPQTKSESRKAGKMAFPALFWPWWTGAPLRKAGKPESRKRSYPKEAGLEDYRRLPKITEDYPPSAKSIPVRSQ